MCLSCVSVSAPLAGPGVLALIPAAWPGVGEEDVDEGIDVALNFCCAELFCQALLELRLDTFTGLACFRMATIWNCGGIEQEWLRGR